MQQFRNIFFKRALALFLTLAILMTTITIGQVVEVAAATSVNTGYSASDFGTLLDEGTQFIVIKHKQLGGSHYAYTDGLSDESGSPMGNEVNFNPGSEMVLVTLSVNASGKVVRTEETMISSPNGVLRDPDISEDGTKVLFSWKKESSDDYHLYEMDIATRQYTQLTFGSGIADVEPKYLPNGKIVFQSTRCISNVDCWLIAVMNLYTCDADGSNIMRLGYDQVHTTYPTVTEDGRILYTRWDYNDRSQMYVQGIFQMFPDGTNQTEVYGNDSNFPTTLLHSREVPGSTGLYISISSGHHTKQAGKLVLVDTNVGRNDEDAVTYLFPDEYCNKNDNVDNQGQSGALYKYPVALNDHELLVSYNPDGWNNGENFGIYYMNTETGKQICISQPGSGYGASQVAMIKNRSLFERPSMVNQAVEYGTYYMGNVYEGGGLEGVEFGTAKYLRVVEIEYRAYAIGATIGSGTGSSDPYTPVSTGNGAWDVKRVLGIVEIEADGSALFRVPANTPIYFQVLNEDGELIQSMRSWSTLMPNETFSCVGCHEEKNTVPPYDATTTLAMKKGVQELQPDLWMSDEDGNDYDEGEYDVEEDTKGFSYTEMVQPILDANCITCHNDEEISLSMIGGNYSSSGGDVPAVNTTIDKDGIALVELASEFKYTLTTQTGNSWRTRNISNLTSWSTGNAPFGTDTIDGHAPNTSLDAYDSEAKLYLRKDFNLSAVQYSALASYDVYLRISYDQNPEIYLNGVQIFSATEWTEHYKDVKVTDAFVSAAVSGNNELAAYVENISGGMFMDFGIYLVPKTTLVEKGSSFKYTTTKQNNTNWLDADYDDSRWETGNAPFGSDTIEGNSPNTNLKVENLYLRSSFSLSQEMYDKIESGEYAVYMSISWDEDPQIYVNGTKILSKTSYTTAYQTVKVTAAFLSAVKVGNNTLAASLINTSGGQFLDFNIYLAKAESVAGTAFSLEGTAIQGPREKIFYSLSYLVLTGSTLHGNQYVGDSTNNYTNWISSMSQCEMLEPYQFGSTQSNIISLLKEGHGNTNLTEKEIQTIAAWIDLGVPYRGAYDESTNWGTNEYREATIKQNKRDYYDALDVATKRIVAGTADTDKLPITISYKNSSGTTLATATDNGLVYLYPERKYTSGYKVTVELPEGVNYFFFAMDSRLGESLIYCPTGTFTYTIPSNTSNIFPATFYNAEHPTITARIATAEELAENRNLAVNPYDVSGNGSSASAYPHASASTQYNSSEFAARNAIDGFAINEGHGTYPLQSWGASENDSNMWYQIDFGTEVYVDSVDIKVRADWSGNHDTYFTSAVLEFSDGTTQNITLSKTSDVQSIAIEGGTKSTSYVKITGMETAGSEWAGLSEVEVYGSVNLADEVPMTGIAIDETLALETGESATLSVSYLPATTTDDRTAVWNSSNPAVATVDNNGKIIALKEGTTTITVTVGAFTDTCTVTVTKPATISSITIVSKPTKTSYYVGDSLNTAGLIVRATYSNGTTQDITSGFIVTPAKLTTAGTQTVTVTYGGKKTTFTVTVVAVTVSSLTITTKPTKLTYTQDETVDTSGMKVKVTYNNGTTETISSGWTVSPSTVNTVGTQTVTVSYGGKNATYTVTVNSKVPSQITSSTYTVDQTNRYISKIKVGTTVTTLLNGINEKAYCKVYNGSTQVTGSTVVGTGMTVKLMDGNTVVKTYTIVVTGDANGDGKITASDYVNVKFHVLGKSTLTGAKAKAADINGDGTVTATDYVNIKFYVLGKTTITPR